MAWALHKISENYLISMPNPNQLYEDMEKLNALYEELCWDHDDELVFTHDGSKVIILNKTKNPHSTYKNF